MAPAKIDEMKVKHSVRSAAPFKIKSYTLPHEVEESIETVLGIYLEEMGQSELKTSLGYCLRELAVNAKKSKHQEDLLPGKRSGYKQSPGL